VGLDVGHFLSRRLGLETLVSGLKTRTTAIYLLDSFSLVSSILHHLLRDLSSDQQIYIYISSHIYSPFIVLESLLCYLYLPQPDYSSLDDQ
jgi:hypothetical protein